MTATQAGFYWLNRGDGWELGRLVVPGDDAIWRLWRDPTRTFKDSDFLQCVRIEPPREPAVRG